MLRTLLGGMLLITTMTGWMLYRHMQGELDELYNAHLKQIAKLLAKELDRVGVDGLAQTDPTFTSRSDWQEEDYLIQVWDKEGHLIAEQFPVATMSVVNLQPVGGLSQTKIGDEMWRFYRAETNSIIVQIGQPEYARRGAIAETSLTLWVPLMLQIPTLILLALASARQGFMPLEELSAAIDRQRPDALIPFEAEAQPLELRPMVDRLNHLLSRLKAAMKKQQDFVADAAHELRTPVASLNLQIDLLERARSDNDRVEAIAMLRKGVRRTTHLIQQLLSTARADSAPQSVPISTVDIKKVGETVLEKQWILANERSIDLGVIQIETALVEAVSSEVEAVIDNLVGNAIRHTQRGGKVDLAIFRKPDGAHIIVSDDGPGIPESEASRIFDRFYRILRVGTDEQSADGSGLGLAIVKAICDRYQAKIVVGKGDNGVGARFTVIWPLIKELEVVG